MYLANIPAQMLLNVVGSLLANGTLTIYSGPRPATPTTAADVNWIRNSTMVGAAAGTPGTLPSTWSERTTVSGVTTSVVGTGTEDGISYIDIRWVGTPASSSPCYFAMETSPIAASLNQTYTGSAYIKLAGGALTNMTNIGVQINLFGQGQYRTNIFPSSAPLANQRTWSTSAAATGSATTVMPYFIFSTVSGLAIDVTFRIGAPQMELGDYGTQWQPTSGTATKTNNALAVFTFSPVPFGFATSVPGLTYANGSFIANSYAGMVPGTATWARAQMWVRSWRINTAYIQYQSIVSANNNLYLCTESGTSAGSGTGPTATTLSVADNTVQWMYVGPYTTTLASSLADFVVDVASNGPDITLLSTSVVLGINTAITSFKLQIPSP